MFDLNGFFFDYVEFGLHLRIRFGVVSHRTDMYTMKKAFRVPTKKSIIAYKGYVSTRRIQEQ